MKSTEIKDLLPGCMQQAIESHVGYAALLDVMSQLHSTPEQMLAAFPDYLNPRKTPDRFIHYLLSWLGLSDATAGIQTQNLRVLMENYATLSRRRGTKNGLELFLHLAFGCRGIYIKDDPRTFHFTVYLPSNFKGQERTVQRIIEHEKPAHLTFALVMQEEE